MKKLLLLFILALLFRIGLSFLVWHPDINNHVDWGIRFWQYGPAKFFAPQTNVWSFTWPNQPPGTIYLFAGIRELFESVFAVLWLINIKIPAFPSVIVSYSETNLYPALLKLPAILSDLGIAYLIYKMVDELKGRKLATLGAMVWLINPAVWYNSAVWGQTDAYINLLAMLAFFFLLKKRLALAIFFLLFSLYTKFSLAIFVPIFAVILLRQKYTSKGIILASLPGLAIIGLLTLPFSGGEPYSWLINLYRTKVLGEQLQLITANAFNLWALLTGIHEQPQALHFGPLTYQAWGVILFVIAYLPTLWLVYRKQDVKTVVWSLGLAAFASFMLLTNMHERYLYPLFPYFTILAVLEMKLMPVYIAVSGINLLNLYNFWWVPKLNAIVGFLSFGNRLMPRVLGGLNFILFLQFYITGCLQNRLRRKPN